MGNQELARFSINREFFYIVGCWDNDTKENYFDFYDLYDEGGTCLNEGNPFFDFPSWLEIKDYLDEYYFKTQQRII